MPESNPLAILDARIRHAWARRSSAARFGEAYWQADDELAWLRMVRDEVARTGYVRPDVAALLDVRAVAISIEPGREPILFPAEARARDRDEVAAGAA